VADITWKRTGGLLRKLFRILMDAPEGLRAGEALVKIAEGEPLSEYEAGTYKSGARRFEVIIRFATVDVVKAGWLAKHKGTWSVTDIGRQAYDRWSDPEAFYKEAVRLYHDWKRGQPGNNVAPVSTAVLNVEAEETEKSSSITYEQADEQAWAEIEAHIGTMNPYEFQRLVADLLKAMGYYPSWVAPPGKDGGIDIIAHSDPLGTRPPRIKVQVKRQQQAVDSDGLHSFLSRITQDDAGIFVCIGGFTRDAQAAVRSDHRKITLVDLERLVELWIEFYGKLDDRARERMPLTPIYFLTPRD
jgi:restriction system protein